MDSPPWPATLCRRRRLVHNGMWGITLRSGFARFFLLLFLSLRTASGVRWITLIDHVFLYRILEYLDCFCSFSWRTVPYLCNKTLIVFFCSFGLLLTFL